MEDYYPTKSKLSNLAISIPGLEIPYQVRQMAIPNMEVEISKFDDQYWKMALKCDGVKMAATFDKCLTYLVANLHI